MPSYHEVRQSDASRPERSFATLGQNERPRESTDKTGPVKGIVKDYEKENCKCNWGTQLQ